MRNYNWENWRSLVEEWGCGFLIGLGVLAGAIAWLGWETVFALFLLLLIPVSPWLFARLEPEEELRRRLTALHYATFIALILFLFIGEIFMLPHRYELLGWTVGLGFWVGILNTLVTFLWFRVIRVLATRRLDKGTLTRSTATVTLIITSVALTSIVGGYALKPRMANWRYYKEENSQRIKWVEFGLAEVSGKKLTLVFKNLRAQNCIGCPPLEARVIIAPDEGLLWTEQDFVAPEEGNFECQFEAEWCWFKINLPESFSGIDSKKWVWSLNISWSYDMQVEFFKQSGDNTVYELVAKHYDIVTNRVTDEVWAVGTVQIKD